MPIYRYQSGSIIDEVSILANENGGLRAYVHADASASAELLRQIHTALDIRGLKTVAIHYEGKPCLEVRGFKSAHEAEKLFADNGWVYGKPSVTQHESDVSSAGDKLKHLTLKAAGISYNIGDVAYMTYAYKQYKNEQKLKNPSNDFFNQLNILAGLGYAAGSSVLTFYGSRDQSKNTIQDATKKIQNYLMKEGVSINDDDSIKKLPKSPQVSTWGKIDRLLAKYPSEALNSIYVGVGGILSAAAFYRATRPISHLQGSELHAAVKERNAEIWDIGLGAITAASAIAGLAIKEKKPDEDQEKRSGIGAVFDWIQEKPLRATGAGFMVATLFHGYGTYQKYNAGNAEVKQTVVGRGIFVAANIVSEILMAISSKGHGIGVKPDKSIDETVIAAVAETILKQPEAKREALIHQLSGYLASPDVLGGKAATVEFNIRENIAGLSRNPWLSRVKPSSKIQHIAHEQMLSAAPQPTTHARVG